MTRKQIQAVIKIYGWRKVAKLAGVKTAELKTYVNDVVDADIDFRQRVLRAVRDVQR